MTTGNRTRNDEIVVTDDVMPDRTQHEQHRLLMLNLLVINSNLKHRCVTLHGIGFTGGGGAVVHRCISP